MTEEDEEFQRLEREAKMRALEDDDIQDYKKPWVGLTDDERMRVLKSIDPKADRFPLGFKQIVESIEQLLKEKNA